MWLGNPTLGLQPTFTPESRTRYWLHRQPDCLDHFAPHGAFESWLVVVDTRSAGRSSGDVARRDCSTGRGEDCRRCLDHTTDAPRYLGFSGMLPIGRARYVFAGVHLCRDVEAVVV